MFEKFKLDNYVVELRYENAYLLWDKSGRIATLLGERFKDITLVRGEPAIVTFEADRKYRIDVRLDRFHIGIFDSGLFSEHAVSDISYIVENILNELEVKIITRVGTRLDMRNQLKSSSDHAAEMQNLQFCKVITDEFYSVKPKSFVPTIVFKVEDDDFGYNFGLAAITQSFQTNTPLGLPAVKSEDDINYIKLDVDYYTMKPTAATSFKTELWLEKVSRGIKRDTDRILQRLRLA